MPKSPTRCSNLKEELRLLRAELSSADFSFALLVPDPAPCSTTSSQGPVTVTPPSNVTGGMSRWGTGSSSLFDDCDAPSPSSSTAQCTPEKAPVQRGGKGGAGPVHGPSVQQNRFHKISDEGCEELKQAGLKKAAARSPTAMGIAEAASSNAMSSSNAASTKNPQKFRFLLVTDFECTCDSGEPNYPHEIIEFPVVVVDTRLNRTVGEFHTYIRPVRNPQLTTFCTELTGITQDMVQRAPTLPEALIMFDEWIRSVLVPLVMAATAPATSSLSEEEESDAASRCSPSTAWTAEAQTLYDSIINVSSPCPAVMFVTDSPTDMRHFMYNCHVIRDSIAFPPIFYQWLNVRRAFADHFRVKPERRGQQRPKRCTIPSSTSAPPALR
ncbi:exonuclease, putative [Bodo saltans]|uniref:Exonuclease, putative n=1 Tax=Bodo saltans TaxID=75058 RepID=A0A0S4JDV1_BODSA|nr:exonuclease, putative [Bodo saltans]|eukprot:CUG88635.1 exonuclease, putative [Bodo saltans]